MSIDNMIANHEIVITALQWYSIDDRGTPNVSVAGAIIGLKPTVRPFLEWALTAGSTKWTQAGSKR